MKTITKGLLMGIFLFSTLINSYGQADVFYNIKNYGAKNDGSELITDAIRKAIGEASAAGGGTIFFPAGEYLTGPIHLKSNITLHLDAGCVIKFSDDFDHYLPMVHSRWEGTEVTNFSPLIYGYEVENVAIVGRGKLDGQGKKWWDFHHKLYDPATPISKWQEEFAQLNQNVIMPEQDRMVKRGFLRPPFIQIMFGNNILIDGITIVNSPFWTVNPVFSENIVINGVTINNPRSPNTDGINPESCRNVRISNCHINVGDDCITIKSGRDADGRRRGFPAENYTITNCTMLYGHGGVVIGSEMSGDVRKITISNCVFDGTRRGIRLKTMRGRGGVVEEIRIDNIVMKNIGEQAIILNMEYGKTEPAEVSERTPQFRNIHISNVTAEAKQSMVLLGIEEMYIDNVTIDNVNVTAEEGFSIKNARNIKISNAQISTKSGPAIRAENVNMLELFGIKTMTPHPQTPIIRLTNAEDAFIHGSYQPVSADLFLRLEGIKTSGVYLSGNNLRKVKKVVERDKIVAEKPTIK